MSMEKTSTKNKTYNTTTSDEAEERAEAMETETIEAIARHMEEVKGLRYIVTVVDVQTQARGARDTKNTTLRMDLTTKTEKRKKNHQL
jgi:hypothetical protein